MSEANWITSQQLLSALKKTNQNTKATMCLLWEKLLKQEIRAQAETIEESGLKKYTHINEKTEPLKETPIFFWRRIPTLTLGNLEQDEIAYPVHQPKYPYEEPTFWKVERLSFNEADLRAHLFKQHHSATLDKTWSERQTKKHLPHISEEEFLHWLKNCQQAQALTVKDDIIALANQCIDDKRVTREARGWLKDNQRGRKKRRE